jgi:peptide/nickel transport system permease protein
MREKGAQMTFLARRIGLYLVTAWAAITINFFLPRLMPGNPAEIVFSRLSANGVVTPAMYKALVVAFGLNTHSSLLSQYGQYWVQLFHGNLGTSITYYPTTVSSVIAAALPWTLALVGVATILSFVIGTAIGAVAGWRRGGWLETLLPTTTFLQAMPYFVLGLVLVEYLGVKLNWFPVNGGFSQADVIGWNGTFLESAAYHAILPAVTIIVTSMAAWIVGMRNMTVTTLGQDYVMVAQAKGLSRRRVMITYAARNAILPSFASFGIALGLVVTGSVLVEYAFSYPGIGYVLFQAVDNEDYPLMQAVFLIITLSVLCANLLADFVYVLLDPRARQEA